MREFGEIADKNRSSKPSLVVTQWPRDQVPSPAGQFQERAREQCEIDPLGLVTSW